MARNGIPQTKHVLLSLPEGSVALCLLMQFGVKLPTKEIVAEDGEIPERVYCSVRRTIQGVQHLVAPDSRGLYKYMQANWSSTLRATELSNAITAPAADETES